MSTTTEETIVVTAVQASLFDALKDYHVEPLWTVMSAMVPSKPKPKAVPTVWKYSELRPLLIESGRVVDQSEAERRVLMLINPTLKAPQTTDTLYAGLQLINPGETAKAHRHQAFALRFIIEGTGGYTAVGGSKLYMERGDVILTPRWQWHDHGKEGDGPMIWLDGLDLPMFQSIPINFAEGYRDDRYPNTSNLGDSPLKYPWDIVQQSLDSQEGHYAVYKYQSKSIPGEELSSIIGAQAERISGKSCSPVFQDTSSFVFHVYTGHGHTVVYDKGEKKRLEWKECDTFCIPSWTKFQHFNDGDENAYLFSYSDEPLQTNLGLHRAA
ncbi:RmlC-like cupin domain-containing protein [Dipodascopsis uninucleata]